MNAINIAIVVLRLGLGLTFLYVGYAIWQDPAAWSGLIQPWAAALLPVSPEYVMRSSAVFDIAVGAWFILGVWVWIPAAFAALHLFGVTIGLGFNDLAARDFGLFAAALALALLTMPQNIKQKLRLR